MSEKAKLTKEQAAAVEYAKKEYSNKLNRLLVLHMDTSNPWHGSKWQALNGMDLVTLARALLVGYEVLPEPITITIAPESIRDIKHEFSYMGNFGKSATRFVLQKLGLEQVLGG